MAEPWKDYKELCRGCEVKRDAETVTSCAVCGIKYPGVVLLCEYHLEVLEADDRGGQWKGCNADTALFVDWVNFRRGFIYAEEIGPDPLAVPCAECDQRAINHYLCGECRNV